MTTNRKMTPADWHEAEAMAKGGTSNKDIARHFCISEGSVRQRAYAHDWETPDRIARKRRKEERLARQGGGEAAPETSLVERKVERTFASLGVAREALLDAAQRGQKAFDEELAAVARRTLAEGAATLPLPRTIGEWAKMVDILCKLERKVSGGDSRRERWVSSLSRVEEAEVVPENVFAGFAI